MPKKGLTPMFENGLASFDGAIALRCPTCEDSYGLHQGEVRVMVRHDGGNGVLVTIDEPPELAYNKPLPTITIDPSPPDSAYVGRR